MRFIWTLALAFCAYSAPAVAQSCSGDLGFSSYAPSYGVTTFDSGPSYSSPISYGVSPAVFNSFETTASFIAPTPISSFYSAASSAYAPFAGSYSSPLSYSAPMSYSTPMSYSSPATFAPVRFSAPAAPVSNCANGNCSRPAISSSGWSLGF